MGLGTIGGGNDHTNDILALPKLIEEGFSVTDAIQFIGIKNFMELNRGDASDILRGEYRAN